MESLTPIALPREFEGRAVAARSPRISRGAVAVLWLMVGLYFATLALLALWPTPVDAPARPFLASVTAQWPWLTYARIEIAANVLLFVPFGFLFTLILRRARYVVLPAAVLISTGIETWQYFVDGRTSSMIDIAANSAGASIGILCAACVLLVRR